MLHAAAFAMQTPGSATMERLLGLSRQVPGQAGVTGTFDFSVASSTGRESAFLARHAAHLLAPPATHLQRHGWAVPAHFGKAPGTVANEIAARRAAASSHQQELSCLTSTLPA